MNEFQNVGYGVGSPLIPQGIVGSLPGAPWAGPMVNGIGGSFLPFGVDPVTAAYAHQAQQLQQQQLQQLQQAQLGQQLAPQGWFGNLLGQVGQPLGGAIGSVFGNPGLGSTIGGVAAQLGQMLPFGADPVSIAKAQQAQRAQQSDLPPWLRDGWTTDWRDSRLISPFIIPTGQNNRMLPFGADPVAQQLQQFQQMQALQYLQQAQQQQAQRQIDQQGQMTPQSIFSDLLRSSRPYSSAMTNCFGIPRPGVGIGATGQSGNMLPF